MDRLFWAKLRGYPWWPAVIDDDNVDRLTEISQEEMKNNNQVPIRFLGSHDYAIISRLNLKPFVENWHLFFNKGSSAKFKKAIKEAQELASIPLVDSAVDIKGNKSGRQPKSSKVMKQKRAQMLTYCILKLNIILGRSKIKVFCLIHFIIINHHPCKPSESSIAIRLLSIISLFDRSELRINFPVEDISRAASRYLELLSSEPHATPLGDVEDLVCKIRNKIQ